MSEHLPLAKWSMKEGRRLGSSYQRETEVERVAASPMSGSMMAASLITRVD